ncbi:sulfate ABC transporter, partial [Escherichia coli]|nr:sulfate ABC transporter [Escherichia coli]
MRRLLIGLTFLVFIILLIIPLGRIIIGAFEDGFGGLLDGLLRPEALHALMMTGLVVLVVTLLNTLFGIMMAIYLVRAGWLSDRIKG